MGGHDSDSIMGLKYWGGGGGTSPRPTAFTSPMIFMSKTFGFDDFCISFLSNF